MTLAFIIWPIFPEKTVHGEGGFRGVEMGGERWGRRLR
jgi:hypothetical protein